MLKAVGAITHLAGYVVGSPLLRVIGALEDGSNICLIGKSNCSNCLHLELVEGKITIEKDAYSVHLPLQLMVFHMVPSDLLQNHFQSILQVQSVPSWNSQYS